MSSSNLTAELVETIRPPMIPGASIHAIASFGRKFLSEVIRLGVCAGSGGGLSGALFTLAVLAMLFGGDPGPTPTPTPLPF
jgi:hypothetical protein